MVAKGKRAPLLGRKWMSVIQISWPKVCRLRSFPTVEGITKLYPDLCAPGLGTIDTGKVKLEMCNNVQPKFFHPRTIPYALRDKVRVELERLEAAGIIRRVKKSDWAAPIVVVEKQDAVFGYVSITR